MELAGVEATNQSTKGVVFADVTDGAQPTKAADFDALGAYWAKRFRGDQRA